MRKVWLAAHTMTLVLVATIAAAQDVARIEQVVQQHVPDRFMGAVLVAQGDRVLLDKAYGSANLEWNTPNTPDTRFRIGSLTKQFTAAAILLLEERRRLSVNDPVSKHLGDVPPAWEKITIYHLLTHTSGIPSFTSFPDYRATMREPVTTQQLVGRFRNRPLEFAPGEKFNYSNSGYALLGYLIEKISGESYANFVAANIFKPLGMSSSAYDSASPLMARRASGYVPSPNGPLNAPFIDMSIPHAAGALSSTTGDLLRWNQGLFGGKLLSPASLTKMTTPFKNNYAFGITSTTVNGRLRYAHGGAIDGFNTFLAYYLDTRVTVVVLGNINSPLVDQIATQLGAAAHGEAVR